MVCTDYILASTYLFVFMCIMAGPLQAHGGGGGGGGIYYIRAARAVKGSPPNWMRNTTPTVGSQCSKGIEREIRVAWE